MALRWVPRGYKRIIFAFVERVVWVMEGSVSPLVQAMLSVSFCPEGIYLALVDYVNLGKALSFHCYE